MVGPAVEQSQYNLFERQKIESDYLPIFKNPGMGTTTWSPLASGLLSGKYNNGIPEGSRLSLSNYEWLKERVMQPASIEKVKMLGQLAKQLGVSLATLSIAWCISNPNVTSAILGATKDTQLMENLDAIKIYKQLTPEVMQIIENIMGTKPVAA